MSMQALGGQVALGHMVKISRSSKQYVSSSVWMLEVLPFQGRLSGKEP
jgi:hypothetical protein